MSADVSGHDFESLKSKRIRYDSRGTLPKLGFVSAGKPLLLASYHVAYNVAKSKKRHTNADKAKCVTNGRRCFGKISF